MRFGLAAAMVLAAGCGGTMVNDMGNLSDGGSGGGDGATGPTGSGASMASAPLPGDSFDFSGDAIATFRTSQGASTLNVTITEGRSTCGATHLVVGKHSVNVVVIRNGNMPPPLTVRTYASTDPSDNMLPTHAEAYVSDVVLNQNGSCQAYPQVSGNGGDQPYSVTITELDATHVAGNFKITIAHGHDAGVELKGSFNAPLCTMVAPGTCT